MLSSCIFFLIGIGFTCTRNFRKTFQRLFGRKSRRFCDELEYFWSFKFSHISWNFSKSAWKWLPLFGKMMDICLLTQKNQTLEGIFGWNIALWQNIWVGIGQFLSNWTAARASLALCGAAESINSGRHILESRRADRCANDAFWLRSELP